MLLGLRHTGPHVLLNRRKGAIDVDPLGIRQVRGELRALGIWTVAGIAVAGRGKDLLPGCNILGRRTLRRRARWLRGARCRLRCLVTRRCGIIRPSLAWAQAASASAKITAPNLIPRILNSPVCGLKAGR